MSAIPSRPKYRPGDRVVSAYTGHGPGTIHQFLSAAEDSRYDTYSVHLDRSLTRAGFTFAYLGYSECELTPVEDGPETTATTHT